MNLDLILKLIESSLKHSSITFNVKNLGDRIRVTTPFLYLDNDHIELFISVNSNSDIVISDMSLTYDKFIDCDKDKLIKFADRLNVNYDDQMQFYKIIERGSNIVQKLINFSNDLQRLQAAYYLCR